MYVSQKQKKKDRKKESTINMRQKQKKKERMKENERT